jgi:hypothetical protein
MTSGWRKLFNKTLDGSYFFSDIVQVTKSTNIVSAGHVAREEESNETCRVLVGKPAEKIT